MDPGYCKRELGSIIHLAREIDESVGGLESLIRKLDRLQNECGSSTDKDYLPDPAMPFIPDPPPTAKEAIEGVTGLSLPPDPIGDLGKKIVETGKEVVGSIGDRVHNLKESVEETGRELAHDIGIKEA